jgi:hypothetical protein
VSTAISWFFEHEDEDEQRGGSSDDGVRHASSDLLGLGFFKTVAMSAKVARPR